MLDRADAVLAPGLRLDRYELLCPLAKGGMAEVWAGRQFGKHGFQRLVAIKTILSAHAADERARRMFLEEGRLAASIRHPNIAAIYDLGDEHDLLFLVLEYVEGDSLAQLERAARGKLPLGVSLKIIADVCQALHAAHELRAPDGRQTSVVQRDVSPQNVLLSSAGAVKVIDFGIAKVLDQMRQDTSAGLIKGKLQYMAPEQALGRSVDRRADIWGTGATLYHLLAGHPPIQGKNELETLHWLTSGREPAPLEGVPGKVRAIVERALAYEPEDRFETAEEMQIDLERALHDLCGAVTSVDIAKVVQAEIGERIEKRRGVVQKACDAADERARLAAEFDRAALSSSAESSRPSVEPESRAPQTSPPASRLGPAERRFSRFALGPVGIGVSFGALLFAIVLIALSWQRANAVVTPAIVPAPKNDPATVLTPVAEAVTPAANGTRGAAPSEVVAPTPAPAKPRAEKSRAPKSPLDVVTTRK